MAKPGTALPTVGVVGMGHTGSAVALRLLAAKYPLSVFDVVARHAAPLAEAKATVCDSAAALATTSDVILLRLPSSEAFVQAVEQQLLPGLTKGKTVINLGATDVLASRRLAEWLAARGVSFLDAPVSGGAHAARDGRLSIFVGGEKESFKRSLPLFKTLAALGHIVYCGPAGSGQVVKGVEQLAMGLSAAAFLEALAYGNSFGFSPASLQEALQRTPVTEVGFEQSVQSVLREGGEAVSVHYRELPYVLAAGERNGQRLPLLRAVMEFLQNAPPSVIERGRHIPSFWKELTREQKAGPEEHA